MRKYSRSSKRKKSSRNSTYRRKTKRNNRRINRKSKKNLRGGSAAVADFKRRTDHYAQSVAERKENTQNKIDSMRRMGKWTRVWESAPFMCHYDDCYGQAEYRLFAPIDAGGDVIYRCDKCYRYLFSHN